MTAPHPLFGTVLVANRGEIACRVISTLRRLGIRSVAVYSDADADARHVALADVAVRLGAAPAADSYLDGAKVIRAALDHGAEAVHPGYGFLAENAAFARACADAGLVFIGPGVDALEVMGDKIRAKAQVVARGVPVVPGLAEPGLDDARLAAAAPGIGFPVLIKPSAGGGGKGMHLVGSERELGAALATARREAAASFGDDTLFLERYVTTPRHIEVQVLADGHGTVIHLGERECSLQRRHQKVIEEAPSALLDPATRARIGQAAVETARSVDYRGAGTVEFIVSADAPDEFFFMEMNTRLQVEHPVTELVTGVDLVEWQLRIAAGEPLTISQDDVTLTGHAVEARVYAEDPANGFLPTGGRLLVLAEPRGEGIRVDSSLDPRLGVGATVSSDYDPMLAKVIAWAPDRAGALQRLRHALGETVTLGVTNNVEFLRLLLADDDVVAGRLDTGLIERRLDELHFRPAGEWVLAAAALILAELEQQSASGGPAAALWTGRTGWRLGAPAPRRFLLGAASGSGAGSGSDEPSAVAVGADGVRVGDGAAHPAAVALDGDTARVTIGGVTTSCRFAREGRVLHLAHEGASWAIAERDGRRADADAAGDVPELRSPMPGSVVAVHAPDGAAVEEGDAVLSIEAMKMEHVLRAARAGVVELAVGLGAQVAADQLVATIRPVDDAGVGTDADDEGTAR